MENSQQNTYSDYDNLYTDEKTYRADFGRPVYWKPKFNGPKDKLGFILVTQQKTYSSICKKESMRFNKNNYNYHVVGSSDYENNRRNNIPEIGELITK